MRRARIINAQAAPFSFGLDNFVRARIVCCGFCAPSLGVAQFSAGQAQGSARANTPKG